MDHIIQSSSSYKAIQKLFEDHKKVGGIPINEVFNIEPETAKTVVETTLSNNEIFKHFENYSWRDFNCEK